jgi:mycofactocin precursor
MAPSAVFVPGHPDPPNGGRQPEEDEMLDQDPVNPEPIPEEEPSADAELVEADLLIEDVSIDGMCGVY